MLEWLSAIGSFFSIIGQFIASLFKSATIAFKLFSIVFQVMPTWASLLGAYLGGVLLLLLSLAIAFRIIGIFGGD